MRLPWQRGNRHDWAEDLLGEHDYRYHCVNCGTLGLNMLDSILSHGGSPGPTYGCTALPRPAERGPEATNLPGVVE